MELKQGVLVLADISGYTRFTRLHLTSLLHAEAIISALLESIIEAAEFPLRLYQLEGDAVLLGAEVTEEEAVQAARDVTRQLHHLFLAFALRERALLDCEAGCVCDACTQMGQLQLKAVLHVGEFMRQEVRGVVALRGEAVWWLRTLIKAPLAQREYILMTQPFYKLSGGWQNRAPDEQLTEPGWETVAPAMVYYPRLTAPALHPEPGAAPALATRVNRHSFARMLAGKERALFHNLESGPMNLLGYLLEGTASGINLLRRRVQQGIFAATKAMELRSMMLVLVAVLPTVGGSDAPTLDGAHRAALLQGVIEGVEAPLLLNKIESDVALFYAPLGPHPIPAIRQVARQVEPWRSRFREQTGDEAAAHALHLRVVLHVGEVALKKIQQFDELAGADLIVIHRLLGHTLPYADHALLTERFADLLGESIGRETEAQTVAAEGLGEVPVRVLTWENVGTDAPRP